MKITGSPINQFATHTKFECPKIQMSTSASESRASDTKRIMREIEIIIAQMARKIVELERIQRRVEATILRIQLECEQSE